MILYKNKRVTAKTLLKHIEKWISFGIQNIKVTCDEYTTSDPRKTYGFKIINNATIKGNY